LLAEKSPDQSLPFYIKVTPNTYMLRRSLVDSRSPEAQYGVTERQRIVDTEK